MKNIQITVDPETLSQVDRIGKPLGLKRSEIVRQALRDWLRRRAIESFEHEWSAALREHPDDADRAEEWMAAQAWSRKYIGALDAATMRTIGRKLILALGLEDCV